MNLRKKAESLPKALRRQIIMDYKETDLHTFLKELFQAMQPDYTVEITHGAQEFGKDLVIVKVDNFTKEIIGVVVKRGRINGKTLGDVDGLKSRTKTVLSKGDEKTLGEIRSQIEQALTHPAETKSILEELPVSKVYVVLAGDFSKNARKRLTSEIASEIEIFDIEWLINNFTEFYPQIFFEGQVADFLQKKTNELEERHRRGESGNNLSKYFVAPLIRPLSTPLEFDEKSIRAIWKKRKFSFSRLREISSEPRRKFILLGDPGTGKTGAMTKLAIDMYQDAYKRLLKKPGESREELSVPMLVTAREFLELKSTEDFLIAYFESEETKNRFKVNTIIVDGLDEIESYHRRDFINKLDQFSDAIGCSYILTSRKIDILTTLPQKYEKYELLPFEFGQAVKMVSKLIDDRNTLEAMKESLERIQAQILLVPLSLMLLVELVEEHKEIPASVTELYDRFFDMALGREDKDRGIGVLFDYLIKKKFLGTLAYREFRCKNRLAMPRDEFEKFLNSYAAEYQWSSETLEDFVQEIERAGILSGRAEVIFKHRSFLDYFAAFYIHENREDIEKLNDVIVDTYFDDIWGEVAFFYIGLRREISQVLLEKIYLYSSEELTAHLGAQFPATEDIRKFLGGRLLQAGWHSPAQRHFYGIENAIRYAPRVRDKFQEVINSTDSNIPNIVSDFIALTLSDLSFNSGFLQEHAKGVLEQLVESESEDDIYMAVMLSWSLRRFLKADEVEANIKAILDRLVGVPEKSQARMLLLMTLIEEDKETRKLIRRQIGRLKKRSPEVFKSLLPPRRKGFR